MSGRGARDASRVLVAREVECSEVDFEVILARGSEKDLRTLQARYRQLLASAPNAVRTRTIQRHLQKLNRAIGLVVARRKFDERQAKRMETTLETPSETES